MSDQRPSRVRFHRRIGRFTDRLLLQSRPELDLFPTAAQRDEALERLDKSMESSSRFWIGCVGATALIWIVIAFLQVFVAPFAGAGRGLFHFLLVAVGIVINYFAVVWVWRRHIVRHLRDELIRAGVPICRECGYDMTGLHEPRCPECGWHADEAVAGMIVEGPASPTATSRPTQAQQ